ncbi:hypothetical protein AKJ09_03993 [Labilithrix luteola]|uniref:Uncharacterized protein n=1 Tax=Labilithrix luteola TaxID=1391654 RepID=A0A0K1PW10_9BACT|nr:hypothetical protein [Labilithrix luteola]AKU97329.1 hypothetical protein AKJ09_03993 [Labilithrix luteola]
MPPSAFSSRSSRSSSRHSSATSGRSSSRFAIPSARAVVRALGAAAFAVGVLFAPSVAHAVTLDISPAYTGNPPSLPRIGPNGDILQKRPLTLNPEGVSLQDCLDDQSIRFPLALADFEANASLQAWASTGADCTQQANRNSSTQLCWQVPNGKGFPLTLNPNIDIPVRSIMSGAFDPRTPNATASICGTVDLTTFSVQFLYFTPGQIATPAVSKNFTIQVDTIGPPAPTGLSHLPGNTRIRVSWDTIGEGGLVSLTGVNVYCDPSVATTTPPTTDATTLVCDGGDAEADAEDADADLDAGCVEVPVEAGGGTTNECSSPNLVPADGGTVLPDNEFNNKFRCGSLTGNTGSSVIADSVAGHPLVNGTTYAVAIAATDQFNNVGPLSNVVCETPEETTDFWQTYKKDGGSAGGGYCSVDGVGLPMGSVSVLAVMGALALSTLRRRRERDQGSRRDSVSGDERNDR